MEITPKIVNEFKSRVHISHNGEDDNLKRLLSFSYAYVESKCGTFDLEGETSIDIRATELVLERTRYAYNDAVEYFEDNFLSEITSLGIDMLPDTTTTTTSGGG
ncbi:phage gp6-like head-tail connector protein [Gracilibacillus salinarum]|uniref:Phage gp6-like head-tail connector protein n=1 Tax=Gracilibacillus salinarum TaxID=2932255 RepID=A0ABY4GN65_9BACI|nr:phage gp6-like head-tail connector protein [Gracilibacillus salinarum]UOQ85689.1 phage gp6-like head-tail connector protein [Gracilibacillus salinarum]